MFIIFLVFNFVELSFSYSSYSSVDFLIKVDSFDDELNKDLRDKGFEIIRRIDPIDVILVRYKGVSAEGCKGSLQELEGVGYIEPNTPVCLPTYNVGKIISKPELSVQNFPNDIYWESDPQTLLGQWNIRIINAVDAWKKQEGSPEILVAVLDTGVRGTHQELSDRFLPLGYNWVEDNIDTSDDNGHGTLVSGIVCAKTNNSYGIAGLAQVSLMAEKILDSSGYGYWADVASAIVHAADMGADIILMSFGSYTASSTAEAAVNYAYNKGCLLFAAAGNNGNDNPFYPAAYENVISVTATSGRPDSITSYSNYGNWIELSAPGGLDEDGDGVVENNEHWILSTWHSDEQAFSYSYGTSMAAPHIVGHAALYLSEHPDANNSEVRVALHESTIDKGETGFDIYYGYGRIDISKNLRISTSVGGVGMEVNTDNLIPENVGLDKKSIFLPILGIILLLFLKQFHNLN